MGSNITAIELQQGRGGCIFIELPVLINFVFHILIDHEWYIITVSYYIIQDVIEIFNSVE